MKIAIGCDEAAFDMKELIKKYLENDLKHEVIDFGVNSKDPVDYPDVAEKVAESVAAKNQERGILICGTGIGMAIAANKVPGIRAACVHDSFSAERARKSNGAQIMTFGARVIGPELAKMLVRIWMESDVPPEGSNSDRKVKKIMAIEARHRG
jgi:ribose 5-phosphate isomerase B